MMRDLRTLNQLNNIHEDIKEKIDLRIYDQKVSGLWRNPSYDINRGTEGYIKRRNGVLTMWPIEAQLKKTLKQ